MPDYTAYTSTSDPFGSNYRDPNSQLSPYYRDPQSQLSPNFSSEAVVGGGSVSLPTGNRKSARERAEADRKAFKQYARRAIRAGGLLPGERKNLLQEGQGLISRNQSSAAQALRRQAAAIGGDAFGSNPYMIEALRQNQGLLDSIDEYALERKQNLLRQAFAEESQMELDQIAREEEARRQKGNLLGRLFGAVTRGGIGFLTGGPVGAAAGAGSALLEG